MRYRAQTYTHRLHWLFPDLPYEWDEKRRTLMLQTPAGEYQVQMLVSQGSSTTSVVRADADSARGWCAPYYFYRESAVSVDLAVSGDTVVFWSVFGPRPWHLHQSGTALEIFTDSWHATVERSVEVNERLPLVTAITLTGETYERLETTSSVSYTHLTLPTKRIV